MKIKLGLVALLFAFCAQAANATNVAVFDLQKAVFTTDKAKSRIASLDKSPDIAKLIAELEGYKADMEKLQKEAETKGLTWSEEEKIAQRKKAGFIQQDFKNVSQKLQKENENLQAQIAAEAQPHIPAILQQIMKADSIDVVLRAEATFASVPTADVTAKVVAELNKVLE
jgi:outer membrane protein